MATPAYTAVHPVTLEHVRQAGATGIDDARKVGLAVANSPLVKTAFFGGDPNWGRIICAAGYSGVAVEESRISIDVNGVRLFDLGKVMVVDETEMRRKLEPRDISVDIDLGMGEAQATVYTSDMSYEYIKINAEYTT